MAGETGVISVDDIAHDNKKLEKKATELVLVAGWSKANIPAKT